MKHISIKFYEYLDFYKKEERKELLIRNNTLKNIGLSA